MKLQEPKPVYEFDLGGKKRHARFGFYCQRMFCAHKGVKLAALQALHEIVGLDDVAPLLYFAFRDHANKEGVPFEHTEEEVLGWVDAYDGPILAEDGLLVTVVSAFMEALPPQAAAEAEGNGQAKKKSRTAA